MTGKATLTNRIVMRIHGLALLIAGWKIEKIIEFTKISCFWLYDIKKKAIKYEFNPKINMVIIAIYI